MSAVRSPQDVLAELGRELDRANRGRPRSRLPRLAAALALATLCLGGTAVATRSIWAPDAPSTTAHGPTATVASGSLGAARWSLAARGCAGGAVSVVLHLADGGAASACGRAGARPVVYVDPATGRGYAFGAVPASVNEVSAGGVRGPLVHAPSEVVRRAQLPKGVGYFVVAIRSPDRGASEVQYGCVQARCGF
jgi:hypothetical protein